MANKLLPVFLLVSGLTASNNHARLSQTPAPPTCNFGGHTQVLETAERLILQSDGTYKVTSSSQWSAEIARILDGGQINKIEAENFESASEPCAMPQFSLVIPDTAPKPFYNAPHPAPLDSKYPGAIIIIDFNGAAENNNIPVIRGIDYPLLIQNIEKLASGKSKTSLGKDFGADRAPAEFAFAMQPSHIDEIRKAGGLATYINMSNMNDLPGRPRPQ